MKGNLREKKFKLTIQTYPAQHMQVHSLTSKYAVAVSVSAALNSANT